MGERCRRAVIRDGFEPARLAFDPEPILRPVLNPDDRRRLREQQGLAADTRTAWLESVFRRSVRKRIANPSSPAPSGRNARKRSSTPGTKAMRFASPVATPGPEFSTAVIFGSQTDDARATLRRSKERAFRRRFNIRPAEPAECLRTAEPFGVIDGQLSGAAHETPVGSSRSFCRFAESLPPSGRRRKSGRARRRSGLPERAAPAGQLRLLSTSAFSAIHGIMARSFAPTSSMGCSAAMRRIALKAGWLTLHSLIHSPAKRPD